MKAISPVSYFKFKSILRIFKFKFKKPLFLKRIRFCRRNKSEPRKLPARNSVSGLLSVPCCWSRRSREMDRVMELKSFPDQKAPCSSPLTPAYIKMRRASEKQGEVEDACRSFENYLVEMIVEEGKMRDLKDVEELLYCWRNLKSPVFVDLVCRFYGELCKDLFSNNGREEEDDNCPR